MEELRLSEPEVVSACRATCENGGECVLPGLCMCRDGWEGITCTEGIYTYMSTLHSMLVSAVSWSQFVSGNSHRNVI